jgi:2,3-bisphosphoglycerate-dependent phosphoglycerate mutase
MTLLRPLSAPSPLEGGGQGRILWIVRHGQTADLERGILQGHAPVSLSPVGRKQVLALAKRIRKSGVIFDGFFSSDLLRAKETAKILFAEVPLLPSPVFDPLLREVDTGFLTQMPVSQAEAFYAREIAELTNQPWRSRRPGGESMADVAERALRFLASLEAGRHLVVTHGGWLLALLGGFFGLKEKIFFLNPLPTSITIFLPDDGQVPVFGDVGHLEQGA